MGGPSEPRPPGLMFDYPGPRRLPHSNLGPERRTRNPELNTLQGLLLGAVNAEDAVEIGGVQELAHPDIDVADPEFASRIGDGGIRGHQRPDTGTVDIVLETPN